MADLDPDQEHAVQAAILGAEQNNTTNVVEGYDSNGNFYIITAQPDGNYTLEEHEPPTPI